MKQTYNNPTWWTPANDTAWDRTKAAFKRDWDQTKHDLGAKRPDTRQGITDTINQAVGTEAIPPLGEANYEKLEPAYRFGYGAYDYYLPTFELWNTDLEDRLKSDWNTTNPLRVTNWTEDRAAIRHGWNFQQANNTKTTNTNKPYASKKTLNDLFLAELSDMYDAEQRVVQALPKLIQAATCKDLQSALEHHLVETRGHVTTIEATFKSIGETVKGKKCDATVGLLKEADEIIHDFKGSAAINAAIISAAQRLEHYEIASYGCLRAWATALKYNEAATFIGKILGEEKAANEKLIKLATAKNKEACGCNSSKTEHCSDKT